MIDGPIKFDVPSLHVVPVNDVITHVRVDDECPCRPQRQAQEGLILWLHRAIGGREDSELEP